MKYESINVPFVAGDGWGMQGGAPNGLGGSGGNTGMGGPPMGGNNQGNQGNMGGNKTSTQVTIPKDVSRLNSTSSVRAHSFSLILTDKSEMMIRSLRTRSVYLITNLPDLNILALKPL